MSLLHSIKLYTLSIFLLQLSIAHGVPHKTDQGNRALVPVSPELFSSLEELSRIVDVSYCVGNTGVWKPFQCLSHCSEFEGFELVTTWNTGPFLSDSCGYIALSHPPSQKRIVVAFRGTYSIANTIVDLSAYPQEYAPYTPGDGGDGGNDPTCMNCSVHAGFMAAWRNTRSTILDYVSSARDQYPDYDLVLVGHSLGGAVAALAGLEMQLRGWKPTVTTFGEPKIGNSGFVDFLDEAFHLNEDDEDDNHGAGAGTGRIKPFRRVTHVDDPVPLLPLKEWGYEMHAGEIFISKASLPPQLEDVMFCEGDHDDRCIMGAESETLSLLRTDPYELGAIFATTPPKEEEDTSSFAEWDIHEQQQQDILSNSRPSDHHPRLRLPWSLIPARYRLWELFFAHRDYFLRVGLCVPGRDQTGHV